MSGLVQLMPGQQVEQWTIVKKLGEGGFGAVYKVSGNGGEYAFKVEGANEQIQVLKLEVLILTDLTKKGGRHFCKIYDKGRYGTFNYVVMTFVGKSLENLNKEGPGGHFSLGTALGVGIQALEALEDLHGIGYLHRDVKPGNYTAGRAELNELRKVYVLDFGMARKYISDAGVMRKPRKAAGFRGTVRYAPQSCHMERELCRKDDVETWLYMQVEITSGRLMWQDIQDMHQVGAAKKQVHENPAMAQQFFAGCPTEYMQIMQSIDGKKFFDAPDYQQIYQILRGCMLKYNVQEFPYDWEKPAGGGMF